MSRYKPIGVSFLPERIERIDARARDLGLSRSKYLQVLVDTDLDGGLLDCTIDAKTGKPVVKLRDGVSIVVLDRDSENAQMVEMIEKAFKTLGEVVPELKAGVMAGNVRRVAERVVKQKQ